jgi:hypothetical protein
MKNGNHKDPTTLPATPETPLTALTIPQDELTDLLAEQFRPDFRPSELARLSVPAGGGLVYEIETLEGVTPEKTIHAVILYHHGHRTLWPAAESESRRPLCSSEDGVTGVGDPGGECATCDMAARDPETFTVPCKPRTRIYLLPVHYHDIADSFGEAEELGEVS